MAKGGLGAAIAAGLNGYMRGLQYNDSKERDDADRASREEDRGYVREQRDRDRKLQVSLANAAQPAAVNEGATLDMGDGAKTYDDASAAGSDFRQARAMGLADVQPPTSAITVQGKAYGTRPEADAAAAANNDPTARRSRQADALDAAGKPSEAITLQNATMSQAAAKRKEAEDQASRAWRAKLGTAMQTGHDGLAALITSSEAGPLAGKQVKAVPTPDGKSTVYNMVGEDGALTPLPQYTFPNNEQGVTKAAFLLDKSITPAQRYEASLKEQELARKSQATDDQHTYRLGQLQNAADRISLQGELSQAKLAAQQAKGAGVPTREERLRYTSLFSEAGRRIGETQKAIGALQKDPIFSMNAKKPGTPEAQQLEQLNGDLTSHKQEREMYQGLLAGSQGGEGKGKAPSLADAKPGTAKAGTTRENPLTVASKAERDKLPPKTWYVGPDNQTYFKAK